MMGNRATIKLLRGAGRAQHRSNPPVGPGDARPADGVHAIAEAGVRGSGGALPHFEAIQRALPDHDLRPIRAFAGGEATGASRAIGARAYALGDRIAFTERSPGLHTAAHEAAHVLQQRAGIQLAGGVGVVGDPYERNADAIADAVVRGTSPPAVLGGHAGPRPAVQRLSAVGELVEQQREMMDQGREKLDGKHTTVGFEFEFATMAEGNPFSGLSHVELAESSHMPDPSVPFVLETDASNALELVCPPLWIPTFGDQVLPEPTMIRDVINVFKERLSQLTAAEPTMEELVAVMRDSDGIDFTLKDVPLGRENLTPRTAEGRDIKDAAVELSDVKAIALSPIAKFGKAGIDAQVNIATDAFGNDLLNQAYTSDRFSDEEHVVAFSALEQRCVNILYKKAFKPTMGWGDKLGRFRAAQDAVRLAHNAIFGHLKAAKESFLSRAKESYDEAWFPDFITDVGKTYRAILHGPSPPDQKLDSYNVTPFELAQISGELQSFRDKVHRYVTGYETFLADKANVTPSSFADGELETLWQGFDGQVARAETALSRVPHIGGDNEKLRVFLNALARALSGQLAVTSIHAVRTAQERRLADPNATMGADDPTFGVHQMLSSRVKDVRGVWAKAPVLDIGLGVLSFKDWEAVEALVGDEAVRTDLSAAVADVEFDGLKIAKESVSELILGVLDGIQSYIAGKELTRGVWFSGFSDLYHHKVKGDSRRAMSVMPKQRPKFMSHEPELMNPRQDTFIPSDHVQIPEIWSDKSRLFVAESRTDSVEVLTRIKEWIESQ